MNPLCFVILSEAKGLNRSDATARHFIRGLTTAY